MVRVLTSAEYLPPLPEELPSGAFSIFEARGGVMFTAEQRRRIEEAAYLLVDGMHRHASQPNAGEVDKRLAQLIRMLKQPTSDSRQFFDHLHRLLGRDEIGDVVGSLLLPIRADASHLRPLSPHALERARAELLTAAAELKSRLPAIYGGRRGPEPALYIDVFIRRLAVIYEDAGGHPSAYHHEERNRATPFVGLVEAVANEALRCFASTVFEGKTKPDPRRPKDIRDSLTGGALEERVRVVLNPLAAEKRAARSKKSAAGRRA
jgi:hypothetical protein